MIFVISLSLSPPRSSLTRPTISQNKQQPCPSHPVTRPHPLLIQPAEAPPTAASGKVCVWGDGSLVVVSLLLRLEHQSNSTPGYWLSLKKVIWFRSNQLLITHFFRSKIGIHNGCSVFLNELYLCANLAILYMINSFPAPHFLFV